MPARPRSAPSPPGSTQPTAGEVRIGGVALGDLADLRRHVVLVTQEVHVFAGTVADNLRLARPDATDDELRAALARVGRRGSACDAVVGEGADELSATQAQQLALARLVLADPDGRGPRRGHRRGGQRRRPACWRRPPRRRSPAGRAIVIAHRLTQAVTADRVVVLDQGRVVEVGRHDELVAAGGPYASCGRPGPAPR